MQPVDHHALKSKYGGVWEFRDFPPSSPLYAILQKLDSRQRLEPSEVAWLTENHLFYRESKVAQAYHRLEALFYEQEFQRTHSLWHLPSASSHWRRANQPKRALKLTDALNWEQVKDKKLKSALLTTRGGAFRDLHELDETEKCARLAIEYQPESHHPYTLMGAICYERGEYYEGDRWFAEAIKRGASPRDEDAEIKRVVREAKDESKRREVVEYLLQKDPNRYAWAQSYLKKSNKKKR
jgi:hypothetical protein